MKVVALLTDEGGSNDLSLLPRVFQVGHRVRCDGIPNTDGGQYAWRITRVEIESAAAAAAAAGGGQPQQAQDAGAASPGGGGGRPGAGASRGTAGARSGGSGAAAAGGGGVPRSGSTGPPGEKPKYNSAPPPVVSYTADVALAVAANAVEGEGGSAHTAIAAPSTALKNAPFARPAKELTEEEKQRAEQAVQQFAGVGDGVGARLLAKMGFGASESSKGGLGRNEQVRFARVSVCYGCAVAPRERCRCPGLLW